MAGSMMNPLAITPAAIVTIRRMSGDSWLRTWWSNFHANAAFIAGIGQ
jgi:hypothetical protein